MDFTCQLIKEGKRLREEGPKGQAGKFSGEVELFYSDFAWQRVENKEVRIGLELATLKAVGEASRGSL
jgi:hypothetical protein